MTNIDKTLSGSHEKALSENPCRTCVTTEDTAMSKYSACKYLNISRQTFDSYIRDRKLPIGIKRAEFKEFIWYKRDLDALLHLRRFRGSN